VIVYNAEWQDANQRYLMHELIRVRKCLELRVEELGSGERGRGKREKKDGGDKEEFSSCPSPLPLNLFPSSSPLPHLKQLCQTFELSNFERDLLLLCAGKELDGSFAQLCAEIQGDKRNYPTFSLALEVLAEANWHAFTPDASLRKWRLIEIDAGNALSTSPLRIDEQILHYLTGAYHLDERLSSMGVTVTKQEMLVQSHLQIALQMVNTWCLANPGELPLLQLCGQDVASQRAIAAAACDKLDLIPYNIPVELLPSNIGDLNLIKSLWERENGLSNAALLLEFDNHDILEAKQQVAIVQFVETIQAPVIIISPTRRRQKMRSLITFDVTSPSVEEQRSLWQNVLSDTPIADKQIDILVSHFNLTAPAIKAACLTSEGIGSGEWGAGEWERGETVNIELLPSSPFYPTPFSRLWDICRVQARPRLDELALRMESSAGWDDLVLPEREKEVLHEVARHIHQRRKVYEEWGFGGQSKRGLGISALFAGASGTGKTMAADVLANELRLDLYRIDLSAVVSKYIGETEKNLSRVFDAAEMGGAILLFDEADALFGKRSEVKDSHDRHANMEVAYLLQRMESYPGLSILTTNLKNSIDQAFLRRIRFIVQFPFPDVNQRAEIWRRVFPKQTPTEGLDEWKLAKLSIAGGNIRNIALNAAFIAAEAEQAVRMEHILQAAKNEYVKMERPLTDTEVKEWV
jgi:ATPase family associated with various cellular activities (AAA)